MKNYLYAALLTMILPATILGQWSNDPAVNNPINTMSGEQAIPKIGTCPNGDSYIASFSSESGNYNVRMQRVNAQGIPQWATDGILISDNPQMSWLTDWDMTADGSNYAILTFQDIRNGGNNNVVAYRIAPDGSFTWGADGIALSNSTAFNAAPKVTVTSAGNAVFAWQADAVTIMQKVSPSGDLLWGPDGITLSQSGTTYSWPQLLPVGTDDIILKYFEDTGPSYSPTRHIYAQRYDADGDPVWSSPVEVESTGGMTAWTQVLPFINDGSDGFFIAWHDQRFGPSAPPKVYVQHINSSGQPVFTLNGVDVSSSSYMLNEAKLALPQGSSDIYVFYDEIEPAYQNDWGISGQKISSSGAKLWGNNGIAIVPVTGTQIYIEEARNSPGDMVVFYEEYLDNVNIVLKATRISTSGSYVWSPSIADISTAVSSKVHPVVNEFQNNQWIMSWEDNRSGESDIYAQNIQLDGTLGPYTPQEGTIEGTVTLVGGTASVTQVTVTAGDVTAHPDATGFYSMVVLSGTYQVIGNLAGYESDTVNGVVVVTEQTTENVDLTLEALPTGIITGNVTLNGGSGDVTEVSVTAGYHTVTPDAEGNYSMEIEVGTYDVTAGLMDYVPQTDTGIVVMEGMTTVGVDFILSPVPTTGFIEGTVVLQNNAGDVTQTDVTAGDVTVHPDSDGNYVLEITAGTYEVTASLEGFLTGVVTGVVVVAEQTTPDVDFFLYQMADVGYIDGYVTLVNGTGDVTEATVAAGGQFTHPSASGYYYLGVPAGTYTVNASHPLTLPDSITGITVDVGETVSGVDFELEIVRGDLVCKAMDTYGNLLNDVTVEIIGPEETLEGVITNDSLIFEDVLYGTYNGTAWMENGDTSYSNTELGQYLHYIIFHFDPPFSIGEKPLPDNSLSVSPNPCSEVLHVRLNMDDGRFNRDLALNIYDMYGRAISVQTIFSPMVEGGWQSWQINISSFLPGIYFLSAQENGRKIAGGKFVVAK